MRGLRQTSEIMLDLTTFGIGMTGLLVVGAVLGTASLAGRAGLMAAFQVAGVLTPVPARR